MSEKILIELGNIQKTLLLPLWGRAVESRKDDPVLIDETAVEIIDKLDYDFSPMAENLKEISQMGWIMRSLFIDKTVKQFVERHPGASVVNIGCGFDTTFNRVDNGLLQWFDLDMPDVINVRKKLLPEKDRQRYISGSFLDDGWLKILKPEDKIIFIAAGVLYYFEEYEIKGFFNKIAGLFRESEIIFDASSRIGIRIANKMVVKKSGLDERSFLRWGLNNSKNIKLWDKRIVVLEEYPFFKNVRKHLKNKFAAFISDFLNFQYMIHIKFS